MNRLSGLDQSFGRLLALVCTVAASVTVGNALSNDIACDRFALAGCSVGMLLTVASDQFPSAQVEPQADGTRIVTAQAKDALAGADLGTGMLRVVFDQSGAAREVWFMVDTDRSEVDLLNSFKKLWGSSVEVHNYDFVGRGGSHEFAMNASWKTACGVRAKLNVSIKEKPARTSAAVGFVRETK